jgi:hypothetical protein
MSNVMGEEQCHGRGAMPWERSNVMGEEQCHGRGAMPWERSNAMGEEQCHGRGASYLYSEAFFLGRIYHNA